VTRIRDLRRRWLQDADYKDAYDALAEEFENRAVADRRQDGGGALAVAACQEDGDFASSTARIQRERMSTD
jgi:hypothetical protein